MPGTMNSRKKSLTPAVPLPGASLSATFCWRIVDAALREDHLIAPAVVEHELLAADHLNLLKSGSIASSELSPVFWFASATSFRSRTCASPTAACRARRGRSTRTDTARVRRRDDLPGRLPSRHEARMNHWRPSRSLRTGVDLLESADLIGNSARGAAARAAWRTPRSNLHLRGSSSTPSFTPSSASHCAITARLTSARSFAAITLGRRSVRRTAQRAAASHESRRSN